MDKRKGIGLLLALTVINAMSISFLPVAAMADEPSFEIVEVIPEPIVVQDLDIESTTETINIATKEITSAPPTITLEVIEMEEDEYVYHLSDEDRLLFEQIVAAEAYSFWTEEDCLTLASVIVNRVNCEFEFEDTFRGVLTEKRQFETYSNGRYLEVEVFEAARNAVDRALRGETNVNSDILYFCTEEYYNTLDDPKYDFFLTLGDADYQVRNVLFFENFEE